MSGLTDEPPNRHKLRHVSPPQLDLRRVTTLDDLLADGVPDDGKPRRLRRTLTAMTIATVAITAVGSIAVAHSGLA